MIKQFRIFLKNRILKKIIPIIDMEGWTILEEEAMLSIYPGRRSGKSIMQTSPNFPTSKTIETILFLGVLPAYGFLISHNSLKRMFAATCYTKSSRNQTIG